jgi:hypothetical protein
MYSRQGISLRLFWLLVGRYWLEVKRANKYALDTMLLLRGSASVLPRDPTVTQSLTNNHRSDTMCQTMGFKTSTTLSNNYQSFQV